MLNRSKPAVPGYSLVEILDRSIRIYRQNFAAFFVLAALVQIPLVVITDLLLQPSTQTLQGLGLGTNPSALNIDQAQSVLVSVLSLYAAIFVGAIISALVQGALVYAPIVYVASENHLGRTRSLREAFREVGKRWQELVGGLASLYVLLVVMVVVLAFALFLCGLGFGLILFVSLALGVLLVPVLMLERNSLRVALQRSWLLGKSRIWVLLAAALGLTVVAFLADLLMQQILASIFANSSGVAVEIASAVFGSLGSILLAPLLPITYTEIYYDIRVRFEGLDIALKAVEIPNPTPADVPTPTAARLVSNEDFLNLALFAIGTLVSLLVLSLAASALLGTRLTG
jgi:hypothetical protein